MEDLFFNDEIDINHLPKTEEISFLPLQKDFRTVQFIGRAIFNFVILIGLVVTYFLIDEGHQIVYYIMIVWVVLSILNCLLVFKTFPYRGYALRARDISYKKGWLWKSTVTVPFNRVQHSDIKEGLVERMFDLARLNVYTAGGQTSDLTIPGLRPETAQKLKEYVMQSVSHDEEE